jgi:UDP-galactopyranose mutase
MDELSAFRGAPTELAQRERQLFELADLVFTGGRTLYEAKRSKHRSVHAFPSSVDVTHFGQARRETEEPADQAVIPHPRLGFFGVIDERFDVPLLAGLADLRPEWQFVIIGPVVKIDPASLPKAPNVHYLGGKQYAELPAYIAGWDVAMLLFARNESTKYISPTKTPEYLAAGRPVVSTSITDVITPYADQGLVKIADTPEAFVSAAEELMEGDAEARQIRADAFLSTMSWDKTWRQMSDLIRASACANSQSALSSGDTGERSAPWRQMPLGEFQQEKAGAL